MRMRFTYWICALVLTAASGALASAASAQNVPSRFGLIPGETVSDTINRAFFNSSGDIYRNTSFARQAQVIIGPFPENELIRDAQLIEVLYRDLLREQVASDPIVRTPDLKNPYDTTLLTNPSLRTTGP